MQVSILKYIEALYKKINKNFNEIHNKFDEVETYVDDKLDEIKEPQESIKLKDKATGFNYELLIENGELKAIVIPSHISMTAAPNKLVYNVSEEVDLTGIELTVTYPDGSSEIINDISKIEYSPKEILDDDYNIITILYNGYDFTFDITVNPFDPAVALIDFNYTDNGDGTYTITGWKGTTNGVAGTEIIIPNTIKIIL